MKTNENYIRLARDGEKMLANTVDVQAVLQRSKLGFITWNNNTPVER